MPQTTHAYLLTRQWRDTPHGLEYEFWASSDDGPMRIVISGQEAVCFVQREQRLSLPQNARRHAVELKNFQHQAVDALYFAQQAQLQEIHQQHGNALYESDLKPSDRYLMERFIHGALSISGRPRQRAGFREWMNPALSPSDYTPRLSWVSLDIETEDLDGRLYSIAMITANEERVFFHGDTQHPQAICCASEEELIQRWLSWMQERDPDMILGWNVIGFDLDFLVTRAKRLNIPFALGRGGTLATVLQPQDSQGVHVARVPGRVVLDGIITLRTATWSFERYELDYVAQQLLGRGKTVHEQDQVGAINRLYLNNPSQLIDYNLEDARLVVDIARHTDLMGFAVQRSNMTGLAMDRQGGSVAAFDHLYLPRLHRAGFVAPNVGSNPNPQHSPGGFVMDSRPGLFHHVLVLDFKSLYPSIIRSFLIDPLGLVLGQENDVPGFLGARFSRTQHLLPALITDLWSKRDDAKRDQNAALSQAIKIIMNSFYGVLGSFGCRFFDPRLASSITRRGHDIINRSREWIETQNYEVIYGDTDSLFVHLGEQYSNEEADAIGNQLAKGLNHFWQDKLETEFQLTSALEIEYETHYRRFYMPTVRGSDKGSKKRYAGLIEHDDQARIVIKGLEHARTDWTRLARDVQEDILWRVFHNQAYRSYLRDVVSEVLSGQRDGELVYRKRLRKPLDSYVKNVPPHVRAARQLSKPERWIEYVMTTAGPQPLSQQHAPLDYEHYIEKQLAPAVDGVLSHLNDSLEAIRTQQLSLNI